MDGLSALLSPSTPPPPTHTRVKMLKVRSLSHHRGMILKFKKREFFPSYPTPERDALLPSPKWGFKDNSTLLLCRECSSTLEQWSFQGEEGRKGGGGGLPTLVLFPGGSQQWWLQNLSHKLCSLSWAAYFSLPDRHVHLTWDAKYPSQKKKNQLFLAAYQIKQISSLFNMIQVLYNT